MAQPITTIQKYVPTKEEQNQQKLEDLKLLLAENEDSLNKILNIVSELNDTGVLEAANSMIQSKEKITKIALEQMNREPVTNIINHIMGAAGALSNVDPETTTKLINSVTKGIDEGNKHLEKDDKVGIFDLVKVLKDPDVNRAVGFGINFLKGMGKGLKE
ncbi:DUF1641 domain-containing protein [Bacillus sp. UNCCL81]|uniref:DUF1641 domain-containing protein n=1 Tax=Bacillus sp. UNCCL81 TaxID=1502755 RepID=UPI0008EF5DA3|nr:DUF1641 domain-containing protein [Bacillus sp. UNCCL81]SFC94164.1 Uncharacterized conserved protein YjgD, DUF1641 family [Bacillus sp. UNCCL81]